MKSRICGMVLLLTLSGCATAVFDPNRDGFLVLPTAEFVSEKRTSFDKEQDELQKMYIRAGHDLTWAERITARTKSDDPFFTQKYDSVEFATPNGSADIAFYYDIQMRTRGWNAMRDMLPDEGDTQHEWVRVFSRSNQMVRVRVFSRPLAFSEAPGSATFTSYSLDFINVPPKEVLGNAYRLKGKERYNPSYHFAIMQAYHSWRHSCSTNWIDNLRENDWAYDEPSSDE